MLSAPLRIFPAQQLVRVVVRDRIELPTFRFSVRAYGRRAPPLLVTG
jgi:hypothetical protein